MIRQILDYLGYVQTWLWIWGIVGTSTIGVLIWALVTRLPSVAVFVLALGTGTLMLIALETVLVVYEKISRETAQFRQISSSPLIRFVRALGIPGNLDV